VNGCIEKAEAHHPGFPLFTPRHPQHILNKNPIASLRLVDHDMRDGSNELSILQNR